MEKCSFCEERLDQDLLPACVEACRDKGLIFGDANDRDSPLMKALEGRTVAWRKPHLGTGPKVFYLL